MLKNHIKIAFRNIWKNKAFSLINVLGLSIGLSAALVIGMIIYYDLTFDKFHTDGDLIYRVTTDFTSPEGEFYNGGVTVPLAKALKEVSGIEAISPFFTLSPYKVENKATDKTFKRPQNIIYSNGNYFKLFQYKWLAGNKKNALAEPNKVVLTKNKAAIYFPNMAPNEIVGRTLIYDDSIPMNVTGIVEGFKHRSDLIFNEFISIKTLGDVGIKYRLGDNSWESTNSSSQLFVKLNPKTNVASVQEQLSDLAEQHQDKETLTYGQRWNFRLQPLSDLHFNANYGIYDFSRNQASKPVLIGLALVALFLLLLGCINFINLNTAQATKRANEIGIRKTLGSSKKQLIHQFMGETFLLTMAAALLSLLISPSLLHFFSDFIPKGLDFTIIVTPSFVILATLLLLVVTLLSGFYPAWVLSRFRPIKALKNQVFSKNDKAPLRKYLTVFQFAIAQAFIIATLFVGKQIHYIMTKDMGFKTEAIVHIRTPFNEKSMDKRLRFIKEIKAIPQISKASLGGNPPASKSTYSNTVTYRNGENEIHSYLELLFGHSGYSDLYGLELLAGRMPINDTIKEYVVNKTFIRQLGIEDPQGAIGKLLGQGDNSTYPIVGVVDDFYQRSLHTPIQPMALVGDWSRNEYSQFHSVHILLNGADTSKWGDTMAMVQKAWEAVYPDHDFDPKFVDDIIQQFYDQEQEASLLLNWATGLAILISCLGLLGLVIHTTERRTKEIGIRKVLGASLVQLNLLLCKEFLLLVGIAFAMAVPMSWWGLNHWLQGFAYKTALNWWVFGLSGLAMVLIAFLTIGFKTIGAASQNPVKSLRTE